MIRTAVTRYHDFSYGHVVTGHESKCAHLHGHNGRVYFTVVADDLDTVGRVVDFGVIKETLCIWLENNWDHKFLVFEGTPLGHALLQLDPLGIVLVPFNPTAENMAEYLLGLGPELLCQYKGVELVRVTVEETRKCSATCEVLDHELSCFE